MRMSWNYALVVAVMAIVLIVVMRYALSAGGYPPIPVIAAQLDIAAGRQLPKGVIWNNRPWFFYITSARQLPDGEYDVRLKAR